MFNPEWIQFWLRQSIPTQMEKIPQMRVHVHDRESNSQETYEDYP